MMKYKNSDTYRIGQISKMLNLPTYVLRFWETEFRELNPQKTSTGQRLYTAEDIEVIKLIIHCRYNEKLTVEGTRSRLKTKHSIDDSRNESISPMNSEIKTILHEVKNGLQEILCDLK